MSGPKHEAESVEVTVFTKGALMGQGSSVCVLTICI